MYTIFQLAPPVTPAISVGLPMSSRTFTVSWTPSNPTYSYSVIWTNLNNMIMDSMVIGENTNSYDVTRLNGVDNYNIRVAAVNMCGTMTSDPVTVYGEHVFFL